MTDSHNPAATVNTDSITENRPRKRRGRKARPASELSPWQLRSRASDLLHKAIKCGELPRLSEVVVKCVDCDERALCYDHRNYYHPLAVDPVCQGCNNRRGPGFPLNPDGNPHHKSAFNGRCGHKWGGLNSGKKESVWQHQEKSVADFLDEHWVTWEVDPDLRKWTQEVALQRGPRRHYNFRKSFVRGLHDWFGVEPV